MTRPIKFCAMRRSGEWVYGGFSRRWNGHPCIVVYNTTERKDDPGSYEDNWDIYVDILEDTVCQFTGLLDKNGNEIYEGDIVRLFDFKNCQVIFERGAFCYATNYWIGPFSSNTNLHIGENGACPEVEIVGNIHDNPELMKGGEQ